MKVTVEVLACRNCRALAVSIADRRITRHKCSGAWEVLMSEKVDHDDISLAITDPEESE